MQESEVTRQPRPGRCILSGAEFKDVQGGREKQGELQRGSYGPEGVGYRVVGGKYCDVEGVILLQKKKKSWAG